MGVNKGSATVAAKPQSRLHQLGNSLHACRGGGGGRGAEKYWKFDVRGDMMT